MCQGLGWACLGRAERRVRVGLSVAARPNCLISVCLLPRPVCSSPTAHTALFFRNPSSEALRHRW